MPEVLVGLLYAGMTTGRLYAVLAGRQREPEQPYEALAEDAA
jgi:hypothetical protein